VQTVAERSHQSAEFLPYRRALVTACKIYSPK
jgi:hypothetical protein